MLWGKIRDICLLRQLLYGSSLYSEDAEPHSLSLIEPDLVHYRTTSTFLIGPDLHTLSPLRWRPSRDILQQADPDR